MTPLPDGAEPQPGLPVGSPAPRFRLPGLYGEIMTLDALRAGGRAVVLVFVSPTCGPCSALMPELARWQVEYAGALRFVLISSGTPEDNRAKAGEHGITEILLQKGFEVGTVYGIGGTPSAVIIHPSGVIGSPVAGGAPQIRALLDRYVELLADQVGVELEDEGEFERAEREAANPFVIGAPAPDLALSDLAGRTVTLAGFRGRDVAVLFWSTTCSFCRQMEPVLRAWEADRPAGAPDLLLVLDTPPGDGQAPHLQSPVLIDHERAAAVALHCTGTPTAVLVDARGAIASQPALGQDAIRPLLGLPPAAPPIRLQDQAPPRPVTTPAQRGVSAGAAAPNVEVTTLRGGTLQLADLRGRETILLFWSSAEEACRRLEPDLTAWETGAAPDAPDLMVVVPGSTAGSQVIRFGADVVIDRDGSAAAAFGVDRMPAAVLVDAQGNVAAEPAVGGPHVLQLLQRTSPETAPAGG
jgi:thiol-disulfide isomerase/thioredoxin